MSSPGSTLRRSKPIWTRRMPRKARTRHSSSMRRKISSVSPPWSKKIFETQQNVDLQQAKVDQLKATLDADQGAIEASRPSSTTRPSSRQSTASSASAQIDLGNIIHPTDPSPLTVLTQIKPSQVIFTLPQSDLGPVREAMLHGSVSVLAFDQDNEDHSRRSAFADRQPDRSGNQYDPAQGQFRQRRRRLWPGEFVHVLFSIRRKKSHGLPSAAVQRGPERHVSWVLHSSPDNTVDQRPIDDPDRQRGLGNRHQRARRRRACRAQRSIQARCRHSRRCPQPKRCASEYD